MQTILIVTCITIVTMCKNVPNPILISTIIVFLNCVFNKIYMFSKIAANYSKLRTRKSVKISDLTVTMTEVKADFYR